MVRWTAVLLALYLALAVFGGIWDGVLFQSEAEAVINDAIQVEVLVNPGASATTPNPVSWLAAPIRYFKAWAKIFTLNFSFFPPNSPLQLIRYSLLALVSAPLLLEFVLRFMGR